MDTRTSLTRQFLYWSGVKACDGGARTAACGDRLTQGADLELGVSHYDAVLGLF